MSAAPHDPVHQPPHYIVYDTQPIEITRHLGFSLGNVVKYVLRAPYKGGPEDLDKAARYLDFEAETPDAGRIHNSARAVGPIYALRYELSRIDSPYGVYLREFMTALDTYLQACRNNVIVPPEAVNAMREIIRGMRHMMEGRKGGEAV